MNRTIEKAYESLLWRGVRDLESDLSGSKGIVGAIPSSSTKPYGDMMVSRPDFEEWMSHEIRLETARMFRLNGKWVDSSVQNSFDYSEACRFEVQNSVMRNWSAWSAESKVFYAKEFRRKVINGHYHDYWESLNKRVSGLQSIGMEGLLAYRDLKLVKTKDLVDSLKRMFIDRNYRNIYYSSEDKEISCRFNCGRFDVEIACRIRPGEVDMSIDHNGMYSCPLDGFDNIEIPMPKDLMHGLWRLGPCSLNSFSYESLASDIRMIGEMIDRYSVLVSPYLRCVYSVISGR